MNEEEEKQDLTGWGGKIARCYLTRQKNREKKTKQPNNMPVTTKNEEGELKISKSIGYDGWLDSKGPDAKAAVIKLRHYIKWWPSGATVKPPMTKTNERWENAGVLSLVGREEQTVERQKITNSKGWLSDLRGKLAAGVPIYQEWGKKKTDIADSLMNAAGCKKNGKF